MYMPDTDICSYFLKNHSEKLSDQFETEVANIVLSQIVLAELRFGADKHQQKTSGLHDLIDKLVSKVAVVAWDASTEYGAVRSQLERAGTPIGNNDMLIAAHALNLNYELVTNNTKHFERVPNLSLVNWM